MLTPDQQRVVEDAIPVVHKAINAFRCRYPSLQRQLAQIDATSVGYLAICRAVRTYDHAQSKVTTYFSTAVRNALLKEIDRNRRARYDSPDRVPLELAEALAVPLSRASGRLHVAIARLPAKSRKLIHARFYKGLSLREIGEHAGCDPRTIRRRLSAALAVLQTILENETRPL